MQRNLQMQDCNNGESELDSEHASLRKEAEQLVMGLCKSLIPVVENCILKVGIHSVQQVIKPITDDWLPRVKDEIQSAVEKKLVSQKWNSKDETTTPIPRDYKLKFLDQVSDPVFTGMKIKGKEGTDIKVALVDDVTEDTVDTGPESSATVEIFLDACVQDFNNNPHFHIPINVKLQKGIGILPKNVKLGHKSNWIKRCECRLRARVARIFDGSRIKEAWTGSFTVLDRRSSLYKKHDQPSLFDQVWRLKNISKNGARHIRLRENNISTVQQFLFLLSVDPQRLQKIFRAGPQIWKGTVDHALKCYTDYNNMHSRYSSSSECEYGVVFAVGQLEGVLPNDSCVPIESVAEAEKDDAWKSLAPAFENGNNVASSDVEASFLSHFPCISNDKNATNFTGLDGHLGQYFENEPPFEFLDNGQNSFDDPSSLWNFDDGYVVSL